MIVTSKNNLLIFLLLSVQSLFAGTMGETESRYDGIYIGADIGIANLVDPESTTYSLDRHHMSATGIVGGGLAGYDYSFTETIKLGVEGFGNANGINMSSLQEYAPFAAYRVSSKYNAGFRFLPGYLLSKHTVGHVLLGYTNAQFTVKDNGDYGYVDQTFNKSGFQCGLGMKTTLIKNFSIRADALYSIYADASSTGVSNLYPYGAQIYHNNFSTLEGDLTLLYKFN